MLHTGQCTIQPHVDVTKIIVHKTEICPQNFPALSSLTYNSIPLKKSVPPSLPPECCYTQGPANRSVDARGCGAEGEGTRVGGTGDGESGAHRPTEGETDASGGRDTRVQGDR